MNLFLWCAILQDTGLWGIYFVTDAYNQETMVFNISQEWMRLCNTISDFEVRERERKKDDKIERKEIIL